MAIFYGSARKLIHCFLLADHLLGLLMEQQVHIEHCCITNAKKGIMIGPVLSKEPSLSKRKDPLQMEQLTKPYMESLVTFLPIFYASLPDL